MSAHAPIQFSLREFSVRTSDGFETTPLNVTLSDAELLLIVGPTSSGKSIIFEYLAGIRRPEIQASGTVTGRIQFIPQDTRLAALPTDNVWSILGLTRRSLVMRKLLGFRDPGTAKESRAAELLNRVGLKLTQLFDRTISSLSSGEQKRVLFVAALLEDPETLLIDGWEEYADPIVRKNMVLLLDEYRRRGMRLVVSARHFPVLDLKCDRTLQLEAPFTRQELALPLLHGTSRNLDAAGLLVVENLIVEKKRFTWLGRRKLSYIVDGANLTLPSGEILCILGPSGCGKTSLLHTIAGLSAPSAGSIRLSNQEVSYVRGLRARQLRRSVQLVFQDAAAVLDPNRTVLAVLKEAARVGGGHALDYGTCLEQLGLRPQLLRAPVDQLSASESQRLDLARSLALRPKLVLWDAPEVGAADTDGGILAAAMRQERSKGCSFLVATQSPQVAAALADRVALMYAGRIIESGSVSDILNRPAHPVTREYVQGGSLAASDPARPAPGCSHLASCARRQLPLCGEKQPLLRPLVQLTSSPIGTAHQHQVACFFPESSGRGGTEAPPN